MLAEELGEGAEPVFDLERRKPEDIVLLQHSSGTTGLQKGVALSHQSVLNQITTYADVLHITDEDVLASWLPLYHDMGLIAGFLMPHSLRAASRSHVPLRLGPCAVPSDAGGEANIKVPSSGCRTSLITSAPPRSGPVTWKAWTLVPGGQ